MKVSQKISLLPQQISKPTFILNINSHSGLSLNHLDPIEQNSIDSTGKERSFLILSNGSMRIVRVEVPNHDRASALLEGRGRTFIL